MRKNRLRDARVRLVETHQDVEEMFRWLGERRPVLAFDTETGGLEWWHMRLRTVQFGDARMGWVIPWEWWAGAAREVFKTYDGQMVAHNATFDIRFLERHGVELPGFIHDTYTMAHVVDPNRPLGLKPMSCRYIDPQADAMQKALKDGMRKQGWTWDTVPVEWVPYWAYSGLDPIETALLWELLDPQVEPWRDLYETEVRVDRMMSDASVSGMLIDRPYAERTRDQLKIHADGLREAVVRDYGVSPTAVGQVAKRLIADGVKLTERTKTGQVKLDQTILESLEGVHPLADSVLQIRGADKFRRAYFEGVLNRLDKDDVIHCEVRTLGARTGRMSVASPALQQIPSHDTSVRRMFVPREGHVLLSIDFSNIEPRVLSHLAGDETMKQAFHSGQDVHMAMARKMYGPDAGPKERKQSKSGTLGELYGIGVAKFAKQQGISEEEARAFKEFYAETFPNITRFKEYVEYVARERLRTEGVAYVEIPGGRRHQLTRQEAVEWQAYYKLVNYITQGTAAELLKSRIVDLQDADLAQYIRLPVHDELLLEVPLEDAVAVGEAALGVMEDRTLTKLSVPITCDLEVYTESWAQSVSGALTLDDLRGGTDAQVRT